MKTALIIYLLGALIVALRRGWHMYSKFDKYDWAYGRVWNSLFSAVLLWPIRVLFVTPLVEPADELFGDDWSSRKRRETDQLKNNPQPCGAFIRYRQDEHGSCGEFVIESKDVESFYQKAHKENSFFRGEAVTLLLNWLKKRDHNLRDATEVPHFLDKRLPPLASIGVVMHNLVKTTHGRVWCAKCGQAFSPTDLISKDDNGQPGWNYERLYCPRNHLLLASENTFCEPLSPRRRQ